MTTLMLLAGKASLVLVLALAMTLLLRRKSAALRHGVLAIGLFCAAAMPALQWLAPAWSLPDSWSRSYAASISAVTVVLEPAAMTTDVSATSPMPQLPSASFSWTPWLATTWMTGTLGSLLILLAGLARVRRVLKGTVPLTEPRWMDVASEISLRLRTREVRLVEGTDTAMLVTCGWRRPTIVLPPGCRDWPEDKLRSVLSHELAHVRRGDWVIQLGAEVIRCLYWFNPLFWLAVRRLRLESERACDDAVLCEGIDAACYASHLLEIARAASGRRALPLALGMAHSTSLEGRVRAMFGERVDRRPITSRAAFVATLGMLAIAVPIAAATMDRGSQPHLEPLPAVSNAMSGIAPFLSPPVVTATPTMPSRSTLALRDRRSSTRTAGSVRVMPPSADNAAQNAAVALQEIPATGSASFSGIVRGPAGTPMAGVPVVITDPVTGAARTVKAAADGSFTFFALPVGRYVVTVTTPGWATRRFDVSLEDGQQTERTVEMRMAVFGEAVTVAAPGPVGSSVPGPSTVSGAQTSRVSPPARTRRCDGNGLNCVTAPIKLVDVRPVYPAAALERGAQGVVILEAAIGPSGEVSDARVLRSPDPALAATALEAVQQWEFTPTLLDELPTAIIMTVTVNFSLQN